jgi:preprotein translocase subunit SecD
MGMARETLGLGGDASHHVCHQSLCFVAGLCLLNFGTGPVRGFAVTLLIGIASTVYTSYFVTKLMFDWYVAKRQTISI